MKPSAQIDVDRLASRLAGCKNVAELAQELDRIELLLANIPLPQDFWQKLAEAYEKKPKPLIKEAEASAALKALTSKAREIIRARGGK